MNLREFVRESNKIEGIVREPTDLELAVHEDFFALCEVRVADLEHLVKVCAQAPLRDKPGMNVQVGSHLPTEGGPHIREMLRCGLECVAAPDPDWTPYATHVWYETLHPFMDGNGRSGRALWAWQMLRDKNRLIELGFLHAFYYQALEGSRR